MHKTSLMSALALVVTLAASAGAQGVDRADQPNRPQRTEQGGGFRRGRGGPEGMLLKGITLTAEQRTQFDKNVAEMKAHRAENGGRWNGRGGKNS